MLHADDRTATTGVFCLDNVEMAQDSLEHAHHQGGGEHAGGHAAPSGLIRSAAVLVAMIAAVAVVVEMSGNDAQTAYLAHDVAASDLWSQYQGKSVRHTVMLQSAAMLDAEAGLLPAAAEANAARITAAATSARAAAAKLEDDPGHDGMRQLSARATAEQRERDHELHLHEGFERSVRGLQIAIVLIGLFMATRLIWLLWLGGALGAVSLVYGILAGAGLV
jgi:hypothetical protein